MKRTKFSWYLAMTMLQKVVEDAAGSISFSEVMLLAL